jgi:hypothetical protein
LLANVYGDRASDRVVKKEAVRQLLAPIMAARDAGMTYEDISRLFTQGGLALEAETLRKYFGEAKLASDLAEDARRHADQVAKARGIIARRRSADAFEQADRVAREGAAVSTSGSPAAGAATSPGRDEKAVRLAVAAGVRGGKGAQAPSPSPAAPSAAPAAPRPIALPQAAAARAKALPPTVSAESKRPALATGPARTIDQIERDSAQIDQRFVLPHDLEVRDGKVFSTAGVPYDGMLTRKQLHLLRQVGRLMAPITGESSKAFVEMPERL